MEIHVISDAKSGQPDALDAMHATGLLASWISEVVGPDHQVIIVLKPGDYGTIPDHAPHGIPCRILGR